MRKIFLFLPLVLPLFAISQSKCEQKILDAEQRRFEAMTRKDTVLLRELLTDDRLPEKRREMEIGELAEYAGALNP